jgi:hypothetical protein
MVYDDAYLPASVSITTKSDEPYPVAVSTVPHLLKYHAVARSQVGIPP